MGRLSRSVLPNRIEVWTVDDDCGTLRSGLVQIRVEPKQLKHPQPQPTRATYLRQTYRLLHDLPQTSGSLSSYPAFVGPILSVCGTRPGARSLERWFCRSTTSRSHRADFFSGTCGYSWRNDRNGGTKGSTEMWTCFTLQDKWRNQMFLAPLLAVLGGALSSLQRTSVLRNVPGIFVWFRPHER